MIHSFFRGVQKSLIVPTVGGPFVVSSRNGMFTIRRSPKLMFPCSFSCRRAISVSSPRLDESGIIIARLPRSARAIKHLRSLHQIAGRRHLFIISL